MTGWAKGWVLVILIAALAMPVAAFAAARDIAGEWVCVAVDTGDGVKMAESERTEVAELVRMTFREDGTLTMNTLGVNAEGTWTEADGGVLAVINGQDVAFSLVSGQLVNDSSGVRMILEKSTTSPTIEPAKEPAPVPELETSVFAGDWSAVWYETGGYWYYAETLFPDGCSLALNGDGTGLAKTTAGYTETLTWYEADGLPVISGSNVFSDPKWHAVSGELRFDYGSIGVTVVFVKDEALANLVPEEAGLNNSQPAVQP